MLSIFSCVLVIYIFGKMSIQVLGGIVSPFGVEFYEFFVYFGY